MNEIIININEANKAQKYQNENELFQIDAFKRVSEILKEHKVGRDTNDITDCRFHDTIFIDGDRGVGKTAFMVNIENYYKNIAKIEKPNYIFLKPVDPTLLEHTEKFLGVIFGKIVEMVSKRLKNNCLDEDDYYLDSNCDRKYKNEKPAKNCIDEYYKALENLSKSLSSVSSLENKQDVGIEEIASYKSSQKLEQYAHEFFQIVSTMFGVNAIVMLIDDVDMAFDKGFDVLEVVRKYLASPFLIPIVAGDMKLYREIVETRFKEKIQFFKDVKYLKDLNSDLKNSDEYKEKIKLVDNLVEQYLHKVFPSEYHIKLKDIFAILKLNTVKIEIKGNQIPYEDLKDFEIRVINWGINQKEFTHQVFTNNTRDFVQYLYHKKVIFEKIFDKDYNKNSYEEKNEKKSYTIITNRFDDLIKKKIIDNPAEHQKTLKLTADFYRYANDTDKKRLSLLLDNDVEAFIFSKDNNLGYSIHKALKGNFFLNEKYPYNKIDKEIVRDKLYLPKKEFLKELEDKTSNEYLALYLMLHDNYYSNTTNKILMITGKFVEAMICIIDKTITVEDRKEKINVLNYGIPFLAGINKNKYLDGVSKDEYEEEKDKNSTLSNNDYSNFINSFNEIMDLKFTSVFLYEMLKKYINNLNIFKVANYSKSYESIEAQPNPIIMLSPLYDYVQRVSYIFLNSIASFESRENISTENIAVDGRIENIKTHSKVFINNIQKLKEGTLTNFIYQKLNEIVFKEKLDEILKKIISDNTPKTTIKKEKENKYKSSIKKLNNLYNTPYSKYFKNDSYQEGIKAENCYKDYLQKIMDIFNQQNLENKKISQELLSDENRKYHKVFSLILEDMNEINLRFSDDELVKNYQNLIFNA
ncbi:hypothetical protein [Arcobacter caeni]|uniref:KAP NTPase domain-containing protein n=1 Tax=Arcobacter caeni TaxID=1912877 RepID=A0A363D5F4_9BACT|nr:hypothetical protein [Arcobacter caeni]PUE66578.1 hypothetical protein B0174_00575 [Arcobacter caeni]